MALTKLLYLLKRHTSSQQLDEVSGLDDEVRIPGLPSGRHSHTSFNQVQSTRHTLDENSSICNGIKGKTTVDASKFNSKNHQLSSINFVLTCSLSALVTWGHTF